MHFINTSFCIQDRKILLLVDNALSYNLPKISNNMDEIPNIDNVDQLDSKNKEILINNYCDSENNKDNNDY